MLSIVNRHPYWASLAIVFGTVVASEIIWRSVKLISGMWKRDVNEILIFNELGELCAIKHQQRSPGPLESQVIDCSNKYCTARNIALMAHQLSQAKYCIDIAMYTFTSLPLKDAIKEALRRGVVVRIISDLEMVFSSGSQIKSLAGFGAAVRGPNTNLMMHHKFCIIDGAERVQELMRLNGRKYNKQPYCSVAMSGSVNWTRQGLGGNWENCIITSNKSLTKPLQVEFNRMWNAFEEKMDALPKGC